MAIYGGTQLKVVIMTDPIRLPIAQSIDFTDLEVTLLSLGGVQMVIEEDGDDIVMESHCSISEGTPLDTQTP